jgi:DNA polymerase-3 subunit delta'
VTEAVHFPGVRGHEAAQAALSRAIGRGQLHHGLLVIGPDGVGKATLARGLAAAIHCRQAPGIGCGTCVTCRRIAEGLHAGVEWIRPEGPGGMVKVDAARELGIRLLHAPFEGDHHVVILDPADALNPASFNALLKSLEEPRPGVHFVLLVSHTGNVLPTILSRCIPIRLGVLPREVVAEIVATAVAELDAPADARRQALAVRLSDGSPGRALALCADESLDAIVELTSAAIDAADRGSPGVFGGEDSPLWRAWSQATAGTAGTSKSARERAACARLADLWLLHLREQMRGHDGLPGLPAAGASGPSNAPTAVRRIDRLLAFSEGLLRNPNARLSLEQTLLDLGGG